MATVLRSWDAPSSRAAASVSANDAINGWMKKYGQQRLNRRLKRAVRTTTFKAKLWESRSLVRGKSYEAFGQGLETTGQQLQAQGAEVQQMGVDFEQWNAQQQALIKKANTPAEARMLTKQYKREFRNRRAALRGATQQYQGGTETYEAQRSRLGSYKQRYKQGNKQYQRATEAAEAARKRYNARYYPVTPGFTY